MFKRTSSSLNFDTRRCLLVGWISSVSKTEKKQLPVSKFWEIKVDLLEIRSRKRVGAINLSQLAGQVTLLCCIMTCCNMFTGKQPWGTPLGFWKHLEWRHSGTELEGDWEYASVYKCVCRGCWRACLVFGYIMIETNRNISGGKWQNLSRDKWFISKWRCERRRFKSLHVYMNCKLVWTSVCFFCFFVNL